MVYPTRTNLHTLQKPILEEMHKGNAAGTFFEFH